MIEQIREVIGMANLAVEFLLDDGKYLNNYAKIMKRMHEELVKEGFTSEQAIKIVANYNVNLSG